MNRLYYGDNLARMERMGTDAVDLIYLDPPFNSNKNYNLMYKTGTGRPVPEQAEAFCDTWEFDAEKEAVLKAMPVLMRERGVPDYYVEFWRLWMGALRNTQPKLLAYLTYMVQRLLYMKTLLRPHGSIYLHCDPVASHYIKVMMDGIFNQSNFRSEIVWRRSSSHNKLTKQYGPIHDTILFYSASDKFVFHPGRTVYSKSYIEKSFKSHDGREHYQANVLTGQGVRMGESGQPWRGYDPTPFGRHWAVPASLREFLPDQLKKVSLGEQLDWLYDAGYILFPKKEGGQPRYKQYPGKGIPYQDIWAYQPGTAGVLSGSDNEIDSDVKWLDSEKERLGYPTQKPVGLLRRIIETSSDPGAIIFDPFCGCGTTIYAAHELNRQWIGCDIAILPVRLIREVLKERYRLVEDTDFKVDGIPVSVEQAEELAQREPLTFQSWFVERVGGFPTTRKSADRGVDGRLYFETRKGYKEVVLSVKGGRTRPTDIRDLRGTLERESNAAMAGFLTSHEPTKAMSREAAEAGTFQYGGIDYPRIQILTIRDIFESKRELHTPTKIGAKTKLTTGQILLPLGAPAQ